ncbi:MAG: hypothetical protein ACRDZ5_11335, partial [Acidimicrobiales bacterium]
MLVPGGFGIWVPLATKAITTSWPLRSFSLPATAGLTWWALVLEGDFHTSTSSVPGAPPQRVLPATKCRDGPRLGSVVVVVVELDVEEPAAPSEVDVAPLDAAVVVDVVVDVDVDVA